jgi:hypothetical protein
VYAGVLEYLQNFLSGRHPAIGDFAASALGALCGALVIALARRRLSIYPELQLVGWTGARGLSRNWGAWDPKARAGSLARAKLKSSKR